MPLLSEPGQVPAVDGGLDLELSKLRIRDPPAKVPAHEVENSATLEPGWNSPRLSSTRRTRILPGVTSAVIAPNGLQNEPVLITTIPEAVFHTPAMWVCPITMNGALGRCLRASAAALPGASRQARRIFRARNGGHTVSPARRMA